MNGSRRGFTWWLTLVTIVGLILRVYYVVFFRFHHLPLVGDSEFYASGANLLVRGNGFVSPFTGKQSAGHPPLYLLWLAIPSLVTLGHATQRVQMLWSCVLGAGSVGVCGLAGREVGGSRCGLVAASIAAFYPNMWVLDGTLYAETMAVFVVAMLILLAYRYRRKPSGRAAAWLGLWCGLATLTRPELILVLPLVLLPLVALTKQIPLARRFQWVVVGGLSAAVVVAPWVIYNATRFKDRVYIATDLGQTMAAANCDRTYNGYDLGHKSYPCLNAVLKEVQRHGQDESQLDDAARVVATKYIKAHEGRLPVVVLARWGRTFEIYHPTNDITFDIYLGKRGYYVAWSTFYTFWLAAFLAIAGAVILRRRRSVPLFPMLVFPLIVLFAVATTFGQPRYRAPAEPTTVILAAIALEAFVFGKGPRAQSPEPEVTAPVV